MEIPQLAKILKPYPLFEQVTNAEWPSLLEGHRFRNLHHHAVLYGAGAAAEAFSIVLSGAFKLVRPTPRGEDAIMYFATPGEVIGGLVMLKPRAAFPISAISLGASTVLEIPRSTFAKAWATNPAIQLRLSSTLYSRLTSLQEDKANAKLALAQRIAALLIQLLDKSETEEVQCVPIPLTRKEISESVGASVEAVIRCLSDMTQQGLLTTEDKTIQVLRADKLLELLKG